MVVFLSSPLTLSLSFFSEHGAGAMRDREYVPEEETES
jgi:hypothetical protein